MSTYNQAIANLKTANWNNLRAVKTNNINRGQWESDWHTKHGSLVARFSQTAANFIGQKNALDEQKGKISAHMDYMDYKHGITNPKAVATEQAKAEHTASTLKLAERFNLDVAETAHQARKEGVDPSFIELYRNANPHEKAELVKLWLNDNLSAEKYKAFLSDQFLNNTENLTLIDSSTGQPSHINWNINSAPNAQLKVASFGNLREQYLQKVGLGNVDPEFVKQAGAYKLLTDTETELAAVYTKEFDIKDSLDRQLVARRSLANELKKRSDDPNRNIAAAYWNLFHAYKGGVNEKGKAYDYKMLHEAMDKEIENLAASGNLELQQLDEIRTSMVPGSDDKKSPTYDKNFPKGYTPEQKWPVKWGLTGTYAQLVSDENVKKGKRERDLRKINLDQGITNIITEFEKEGAKPTEGDLNNAEQAIKDLADGESIERWNKWRESFIINPKVSEGEMDFWKNWDRKGNFFTGNEHKMSPNFRGTAYFKKIKTSESKWLDLPKYETKLGNLETYYKTNVLKAGFVDSVGNAVTGASYTVPQERGWELIEDVFQTELKANGGNLDAAANVAQAFMEKNNTGKYEPDSNKNGIFATHFPLGGGGTTMPLLQPAWKEELGVPNQFDQAQTYKTINTDNGGNWKQNILSGKFGFPAKDYNASLYNTGRIDQDVINLSEATNGELSPFEVMDLLQQSNKLGNLNPELIPEEENIVNTYLPKTLKKIIMGGNATPTQKKIANSIIYTNTDAGTTMSFTNGHENVQAIQEAAQAGNLTNKEETIKVMLDVIRGQIDPENNGDVDPFADLNIDEGGVENLDQAITPEMPGQLIQSDDGQWSYSEFDWRATPTNDFLQNQNEALENVTGQQEALNQFYNFDVQPMELDEVQISD